MPDRAHPPVSAEMHEASPAAMRIEASHAMRFSRKYGRRGALLQDGLQSELAVNRGHMRAIKIELDWGKRTGLSVAVKLSCTIVVFFLLAIALCVACALTHFTNALERTYNDTAYGVAKTASLLIDPDSIDGYLHTRTTDENWQTTHDALQNLCDQMGCTFIYVFRLTEDESAFEFVYEACGAASGYSEFPLGYRMEVSDDSHVDSGYVQNYKAVLEGQTPSEDYLYSYPVGSDEANTTAYVPLKRSDGSAAGMLVVEMPMKHVLQERSSFLREILFVSSINAVIILVMLLILMYKRMVEPIKRINNEARRFAEEQATPSDVLLGIKNRDELGMLARTMTKLEYETCDHIDRLQAVTAERERVGAELSMATRIQQSALPMAFPVYPETPDYRLFAVMRPAKEVGGDFYDFFKVDDDHLCLVIADVSDKGVPAALFMMASKNEIKSHAMAGIGAAEALRRANETLCSANKMDMFVTVWIGIYEMSTHTLTCANAGHEYPILRRADGEFELYKDKHKLPLGTFPNVEYNEYRIQLAVGDTLFVYTDGVPEATNANMEPFGLERTLACLNAHKDEDPKQIVESLVGDVMEFTGEAEQFDDVTALCFQVAR